MTRHVRRPHLVVLVLLFALGALVALPGSAGAATAYRPRIIGGDPAPYGEYKFQAALLDLAIPGNDYDRQICGGSLVAPTWVLTAAHCVVDTGLVDWPDLAQIILGRTDLTKRGGERHAVKAVYASPKYNPVTDADDVALIQLSTPSAYTPIRVAQGWHDSFEAAGTILTVIGWGDTIPVPAHEEPVALSYPHRLQVVHVPVVSDAECRVIYQANGTPIVASKTVCAGATNLDACYGDSGGPLFATTPAGPIEIGIVASGEGCGAPGYPGTYTEVNAVSVKNFIAGTIAAHP